MHTYLWSTDYQWLSCPESEAFLLIEMNWRCVVGSWWLPLLGLGWMRSWSGSATKVSRIWLRRSVEESWRCLNLMQRPRRIQSKWTDKPDDCPSEFEGHGFEVNRSRFLLKRFSSEVDELGWEGDRSVFLLECWDFKRKIWCSEPDGLSAEGGTWELEGDRVA